MKLNLYRYNGTTLLFLIPFIALAAVGAVAGQLVWCLLKLLWFLLAVAPFRIIAGTRDGLYNRKLDRAEGRMRELVG